MASFQSRCPNCRQSVAYRFTPSEERELFRALKVGIVCPACQGPFAVQLGPGGEFTTMVIRPNGADLPVGHSFLPSPDQGLPPAEKSPQLSQTLAQDHPKPESPFIQESDERWEAPANVADAEPPFRPLDPAPLPQPTENPASHLSFREPNLATSTQNAPPFELLGGGGNSSSRRRTKPGTSAWGRFYEWFAQLPVWQQYTALAALFGLAIAILLFPTPNTGKNANAKNSQKQRSSTSTESAADEEAIKADAEKVRGLPPGGQP